MQPSAVDAYERFRVLPLPIDADRIALAQDIDLSSADEDSDGYVRACSPSSGMPDGFSDFRRIVFREIGDRLR